MNIVLQKNLQITPKDNIFIPRAEIIDEAYDNIEGSGIMIDIKDKNYHSQFINALKDCGIKCVEGDLNTLILITSDNSNTEIHETGYGVLITTTEVSRKITLEEFHIDKFNQIISGEYRSNRKRNDITR